MCLCVKKVYLRSFSVWLRRSQVVREACVTIAYMSQELHHKVDHLCETVLPNLINLIPNSAKVSIAGYFFY